MTTKDKDVDRRQPGKRATAIPLGIAFGLGVFLLYRQTTVSDYLALPHLIVSIVTSLFAGTAMGVIFQRPFSLLGWSLGAVSFFVPILFSVSVLISFALQQ